MWTTACSSIIPSVLSFLSVVIPPLGESECNAREKPTLFSDMVVDRVDHHEYYDLLYGHVHSRKARVMSKDFEVMVGFYRSQLLLGRYTFYPNARNPKQAKRKALTQAVGVWLITPGTCVKVIGCRTRPEPSKTVRSARSAEGQD